MHRLVGCAVKDDRANEAGRIARAALRPRRRGRARGAAHGSKGRGHVRGRPIGQAGVDADSGINLRIGRAQDCRHRAASRQASYIDHPGIGTERRRYGLRNPGENGRFPLAAHLVAGLEPVPARRLMGAHRLTRISDDEAIVFRKLVHPRSGGKVVGVLGAAMEHDQQRRIAASLMNSECTPCSPATQTRM